MELRRRRRAGAAALALAAFSLGQGCHSWRPVPAAAGRPAPKQQARVQSASPFLVLADPPGDLVPGSVPCRATLAEGDASGTRGGDTVTLGYLARVVPATAADEAPCAALRTASVVIRPDAAALAAPTVTALTFDKRRTAIVVGVTAAVLIAIVAYAVSTMEYDLGSGDSCTATFC